MKLRPGRALLGAAALAAATAAITGAASAGAGEGWRSDLLEGFPQPRAPANNPMSRDKVAVGRRLFNDERLSGNGTQSCSSCHRPELAFTDGLQQSVGSTGEVHPRNAQSLLNVVYQSTLTWANPALVSLERQMEVPLFGTEPVEMGVTDAIRDAVLARIQKDRWYRARFKRAGLKITWTNVIKAIAVFQRSLVRADSRDDRGKLTKSETRGMELFMGERAECHHCHGSFIFNDQTTYRGAPGDPPVFHTTGLYNLGGTGAFPEPNRGVFELSGDPEDMGKFKAPSLRNVARTAPYMHDGSIGTLEEAVDHYAAGGRNITAGPFAGDGRASPLKDPLIAGIDLSARDRADLVAFLKALSDRRW